MQCASDVCFLVATIYAVISIVERSMVSGLSESYNRQQMMEMLQGWSLH